MTHPNLEQPLKDIFQNVNDWLKFAEAKNGVLFAASGALAFGSVQILMEGKASGGLLQLCFLVITVFSMASVFFSLWSFAPRTTPHSKTPREDLDYSPGCLCRHLNKIVSWLLSHYAKFCYTTVPLKEPREDSNASHDPRNLLFYGHIAELDADTYLKRLSEATKRPKEIERIQSMDRFYAEQIITNAKIASRKYKLFNCALHSIVLGLIFSSILGVIAILVSSFYGEQSQSNGKQTITSCLSTIERKEEMNTCPSVIEIGDKNENNSMPHCPLLCSWCCK